MTASSQIVFALRAALLKYTLTIRPTFGWLLCLAIEQSHQNPRPHHPLYFHFFCPSISHPKRRANVLPHAFRPFESPLQPPPRRHHLSVGCHVSFLNGGHLKQVHRPSLNSSMGAILAPQTKAGASTRLMGRRGAAIRIHGGCRRHGEGEQSRWG